MKLITYYIITIIQSHKFW